MERVEPWFCQSALWAVNLEKSWGQQKSWIGRWSPCKQGRDWRTKSFRWFTQFHSRPGNFTNLRPSPRWRIATAGWAKDSCTALLPYHQPIRRKSCTLQFSPQILPLKLNLFSENCQGVWQFFSISCLFTLLCPHIKLFSVPNSDISVCLASLCVGRTNLDLATSSHS